ncbi:MAG: macro domain-containing protein [Candidatus Omnitrophota bacterium]
MITIKLADITKEDVDVIVNAANTRLAGGGGVDGAIHRAAGSSILEECLTLGSCKIGEAVITNAGKLKAKKIIHTPGPIWQGGLKGEPQLLKNSYVNSLLLAKKHNLKTIAIPAISTGAYGYPKPEATTIALKAAKEFEKDFQEIRFVCFSKEDFDIYQRIWRQLAK